MYKNRMAECASQVQEREGGREVDDEAVGGSKFEHQRTTTRSARHIATNAPAGLQLHGGTGCGPQFTRPSDSCGSGVIPGTYNLYWHLEMVRGDLQICSPPSPLLHHVIQDGFGEKGEKSSL